MAERSNTEAVSPVAMRRIRLRAPASHGRALNVPPLSSVDEWVNANVLGTENWSARLNSIRELAVDEIPKLAYRYSRQYLDCEAATPNSRILMSGHQPTLFHAGVWYKNFALSSLSQRLRATAVNLVVDNDLFGGASIAVPQQFGIDNQWGVTRVAFDSVAAQLPHENIKLADAARFANFGPEVASTIRPIVAAPLIESLWPEVEHARGMLPAASPSAWIAAGRHRLEHQLGLRSLELPVSWMAKTQSFAEFFAVIVGESARMAEIYNASVQQYRRLHRIRSRSHPVPEMETKGDWCEVPFWVWTRDDPSRRRLFVRSNGRGEIELSDEGNWFLSLATSGLAGSFRELNSNGDVSVRPRALMTTMFSRLFASDLFLHGIGGSKYDQLNDHIIQQFWNVTPPRYLTLTATMKLPIEFENVTRETISEVKSKIRDFDFHPERFIDSKTVDRSVRELLQEKKDLLATASTSANKKAWLEKLQAVNQHLSQTLEDQKQESQAELQRLNELYPTSQMLASREFSFVLFPESMVDQLKQLC